MLAFVTKTSFTISGIFYINKNSEFISVFIVYEILLKEIASFVKSSHCFSWLSKKHLSFCYHTRIRIYDTRSVSIMI